MSGPQLVGKKKWSLLRVPALHRGDILGVVAPASGFDRTAFASGLKRLESLGYRLKIGNVQARAPQYFAGSADDRANDLHAMYANPEVRAIICARGGYGSVDLLPLLDLDRIARNPKLLIGCSDISSVQSYLLEKIGCPVVHGPMVAGDFAQENGVDLVSWTSTVEGKPGWIVGQNSGLTALSQGYAQGILLGGCLSLLVASLATPYECLTLQHELVLFVEDIGAKPYQIERMLRQLMFAGKFANVKGIVFGEMKDCEQPGGVPYTLKDVLLRVLKDFKGPIGFGLRSGHVTSGNVSLPFGVKVELDLDNAPELRFLDSTISSAASAVVQKAPAPK